MPIYPLNSEQALVEKKTSEQRFQDWRRGGDSDLAWYEKRPGKNHLRILGPLSKRGQPELMVYRHRWLPPDGNTKHTCVRYTQPHLGLPCRICEVLKALAEEGHDVSTWHPDEKAYYWVLDRKDQFYYGPGPDDQKPIVGIKWQIAQMPWSCHQAVWEARMNPEQFGNPFDIAQGLDFWFDAMAVNDGGREVLDIQKGKVRYKNQQFLPNRCPVHTDLAMVEASIAQLSPLEEIFWIADPRTGVKIVEDIKPDDLAKRRENAIEALKAQSASADALVVYVRAQAKQHTPIAPQTPAAVYTSPPAAVIPAAEPSALPTHTMRTVEKDELKNPMARVLDPVLVTKPLESYACYGCHDPKGLYCIVCPHELQCKHDASKIRIVVV